MFFRGLKNWDMSDKAVRREWKSPGSSEYIDLEAILGWLRCMGATMDLISTPVGDRVARTFRLLIEGKEPQPVTVPLVSYCAPWTHLSLRDMRMAMDATRVEIPAIPIPTNLGTIKDFPSRILTYSNAIAALSKSEGIHGILLRVSGALPFPITILDKTEGFGPNGTPITHVTIAMEGKKIGVVTCAGRGYSLTCPPQRFIESIFRLSPPDTARMIANKAFHLV